MTDTSDVAHAWKKLEAVHGIQFLFEMLQGAPLIAGPWCFHTDADADCVFYGRQVFDMKHRVIDSGDPHDFSVTVADAGAGEWWTNIATFDQPAHDEAVREFKTPQEAMAFVDDKLHAAGYLLMGLSAAPTSANSDSAKFADKVRARYPDAAYLLPSEQPPNFKPENADIYLGAWKRPHGSNLRGDAHVWTKRVAPSCIIASASADLSPSTWSHTQLKNESGHNEFAARALALLNQHLGVTSK